MKSIITTHVENAVNIAYKGVQTIQILSLLEAVQFVSKRVQQVFFIEKKNTKL